MSVKGKKQRVLIVHNYYQIPGGEDTVVANEKELLEQHGHEVSLYSRHNSEIANMGMLQKILLPIIAVFNFKTYRDIKKFIHDRHIDIVHVHNTWSLISPSVYYAAKSCKVPIVQTIHNFRLLCAGATFYREGHICEECIQKGVKCALKYNCYRNSRIQTFALVISNFIHRVLGTYGKIHYICLTDFNKGKLLKLKQVKQESVFVKPNFVIDRESVVSVERQKNRIIYAGRLDRLKGVDIMLEAWKYMGIDAPELIICGTGPLEEWCKRFIVENNLKKVTLLGFVSNEEIRGLIATGKALILPTQWYEGFPMSLVEAFSVGTPVIVSDIGNVGEIVEEGELGVKFCYDSPKELVKAVRKLDNNYEEYHTKVLQVYKNKYSAEVNYNQLIAIYDSILSQYAKGCNGRKNMKKSNFELLRVISILMITLHHITFTLGIDATDMYTRLWAQFFYIGGKVGVNCFILISGYFLSQMKFDMRRIIKTHTRVVAYCMTGLLCSALINEGGVKLWDILKSVFPVVFNTYWFVAAYIGMLVCSPVLNWIVKNADLRMHTTLIISGLLLFTIIPTFTAQTPFNSNVTWFCLMYLLGAYFRKYNTKLKYWLSKGGLFPVMWMLIWSASVVFTIGERWIPALREGTNFFTGMYILPQLINSVSLFLLLERKIISNKLINYFGKHTFAGYLVQSNFIFSVMLSEFYLQVFNMFPKIAYPIIAMCLAVLVIAFATVCDTVYDFLLNSRVVARVEEKIENISMGILQRVQGIFEVMM